MRLLLGVDGGGTKTRATLAKVVGDGFEIIAHGQSGSSNVVTNGMDVATKCIRESIRIAFSQIDREPSTVESACFAIAGSERELVREPLNRWIENENIAIRNTLVNDAEPILFSACKSGHGVAVISGTGSLAFGRKSTGETARAGGWGPLISDEGSGYWIAIEGLKAVMRSSDRRAPVTHLTDLIQRELDVRSIAEIPRVIGQMDRSQIASLASHVTVASENADLAARQILEAAGTELAELAICVFEQLEIHEDRNIAISGSVLLNSSIVSESFRTTVDSSGMATKISRVTDCAIGLMTIAQRNCS